MKKKRIGCLLLAGLLLFGTVSPVVSASENDPQETIEALESELAVLESENAELKAENKELKTKNQNYTNTVRKLQNEVETYKSQVEHLMVTAETDPAPQELPAQTTVSTTAAGVDLVNAEPGTTVDAASLDLTNSSAYFIQMEIPDAVWEKMYGRSYRDNNDIQRSDLRYLKLLHYNFNGEIQVGELVVNAQIADKICEIFRKLFDLKYQIKSMYLIDNYWTGDPDTTDYASIDVDNTSAFCYRYATGSSNLSKHALGFAIDLNPLENPYVSYSDGGTYNAHSNATAYVNRDPSLPHVITESDSAYQIFVNEYGFEWGGNWGNPKDYQHFQWVG